jgi:hypothetical protein
MRKDIGTPHETKEQLRHAWQYDKNAKEIKILGSLRESLPVGCGSNPPHAKPKRSYPFRHTYPILIGPSFLF